VRCRGAGAPAGLVRRAGQPEDDRAREAAAAQHRGIDLVWAVAGADHEDAALACNPSISASSWLTCDLDGVPATGDSVDLVD